jgi:hypothetical protein
MSSLFLLSALYIGADTINVYQYEVEKNWKALGRVDTTIANYIVRYYTSGTDTLKFYIITDKETTYRSNRVYYNDTSYTGTWYVDTSGTEVRSFYYNANDSPDYRFSLEKVNQDIIDLEKDVSKGITTKKIKRNTVIYQSIEEDGSTWNDRYLYNNDKLTQSRSIYDSKQYLDQQYYAFYYNNYKEYNYDSDLKSIKDSLLELEDFVPNEPMKSLDEMIAEYDNSQTTSDSIFDFTHIYPSYDRSKFDHFVITFTYMSCPPCQQIKPLLDSLHLESKGSYDVFSVSIDDFEDERIIVRDSIYATKKGYNYKYLYVPKEYAFSSRIPDGYPTTIITNRDGIILYKISGYLEDKTGKEIRNALKTLLGK